MQHAVLKMSRSQRTSLSLVAHCAEQMAPPRELKLPFAGQASSVGMRGDAIGASEGAELGAVGCMRPPGLAPAPTTMGRLSLDMPDDSRRQGTRWGTLGLAVCCLLATLLLSPLAPPLTRGGRRLTPSQAATLQASRDRCSTLHVPAGPPPGFARRSRSERAIEGAHPLVIRNVTLWTARPEPGDEFGEVLEGVDVFVAEGIIQAVERSGKRAVPRGATVIDGHLAWMTPGLIDVSAAAQCAMQRR